MVLSLYAKEFLKVTKDLLYKSGWMSPKIFKCNIFNTRETLEAAGASPKLWLLTKSTIF